MWVKNMSFHTLMAHWSGEIQGNLNLYVLDYFSSKLRLSFIWRENNRTAWDFLIWHVASKQVSVSQTFLHFRHYSISSYGCILVILGIVAWHVMSWVCDVSNYLDVNPRTFFIFVLMVSEFWDWSGRVKWELGGWIVVHRLKYDWWYMRILGVFIVCIT